MEADAERGSAGRGEAATVAAVGGAAADTAAGLVTGDDAALAAPVCE